MDTLAASKTLRCLRDVGLFAQKDRGSATWYQPTARMLVIDNKASDKGSAGAAQPASELAAQGAAAVGLSSNPPAYLVTPAP